MRVLMIESDRGAAIPAMGQLEDAGHELVTCRGRHDPPFPCRGMYGDCPLDDAPVDVAVLVRAHPWPRPTALEQGVSCALRERVPLVVTGKLVLDPFDDFATETVDRHGDLPAAVERAAESWWEDVSEVAAQALADGLRAAGLPTAGMEVSVHPREPERWLVTVRLAHATTPLVVDDLSRRIVRAFHGSARRPRELTVEISAGPGSRTVFTARLG